jgi:hypothetical protein
VERLAPCPSLPTVHDAIFTSIDALPGDSGSPLVDAKLRVIGVIHGGVRCHIASPVAPLARMLEKSASESIGPHAQKASRAPEVAEKPFWRLIGPAFWLHLRDVWAEVEFGHLFDERPRRTR